MVKKCGSDYVYLGLLNGMRRIFCENQAIIPDQKINLLVKVDGALLYKWCSSLQVDGALLYKSANAEFWSVLFCFQKMPPLFFWIYYGNRKPFIVEEFVLEVFTKNRSLQNDNIEFRGVKLGIETL